MKWVIRGLVAFVALVAVISIAAFIFLSTFNPNDYKGQITTAAKTATGRDLTIDGNIQASLFPILGFTVNGVTLSNPAGFGTDSFLKLKSAQVGVKILPLLQKQIELTTVILDQPEIQVIRLKDGRTNLSFTPEQSGTSSTPAPTTTANGTTPTYNIQVGKIKITNARLTYDDRGTGQITKIDPLNLTLPGFTPNKPATIDLDMTAIINKMTVKVKTSGTTTLSLSPKTIDIKDLKTTLSATGGALPGDMTTALTTNGTIDLDAQKLDLAISDTRLRYLDTDLNGTASVKGAMTTPAITFAVSSPRVDLDKFSAGKNGNKGNDASSPAPAANSTATNQPLFPVDLLRTLNINGDIKIDTLMAQKLKLENLSAKIAAKNGDIKITPVTADLYDGKLTSSVSLNVAGSTPVLTLKTNIENANMGPIVAAKMGDDYITGVANTTLDLTLMGNNVTALKNSMGGTVRIAFEKGTIQKWQLSQLINQAIAIYKTKQIAPLGDDQLYFAGLTATFLGQNGVFQNNDLTLAGPKLHAFGNGVINLPQNTVDYTVQVGDGAPDKTAKHIPITIAGPLTAPSYQLDAQSILTDLVKDKVEKKLKQKLLDKLGPLTGSEEQPSADGTTPDGTTTPTTPEDVGKELLRGLLR